MNKTLASLLGEELPALRIVDVGAMDLGAPPYAALLALPGASVVGFEPNPIECSRLNQAGHAQHTYLPYFVGDGRTRTFHWCEWAATSSLYPPNERLLARFTDLPELVKVRGTEQVSTLRLDDLRELDGGIDLLKIDVQGATLDVLQGAPRALERTLVVQCEAEFVPLYEGEPLFAEIDQEMRRQGFLFHQFHGTAARAFAPLRRKADAPVRSTGQLLWTDAVYVRSFLRFDELTADQLVRLALVLETQYGSRDLALLALQHADAKSGRGLWEAYSVALTGAVKDKPPL